MAIITSIYCSLCKQTKQVSHSVSRYPTVCSECEQKQKDAARAEHLAQRAALPLEERIALIEGALYDIAHRPQPFDWNTPIG